MKVNIIILLFSATKIRAYMGDGFFSSSQNLIDFFFYNSLPRLCYYMKLAGGSDYQVLQPSLSRAPESVEKVEH